MDGDLDRLDDDFEAVDGCDYCKRQETWKESAKVPQKNMKKQLRVNTNVYISKRGVSYKVLNKGSHMLHHELSCRTYCT